MKKVEKYIITYILMIILFFIMLFITSLIPREVIKPNIKKSADILFNDGEFFKIPTFGKEINSDISTDAIMLNIVYSMDDSNRIESIMKNRRNYIPEKTQIVIPDVVGDLHHEGERYLMTKELKDTANDIELKSYEYARYWHGYIIILRPLLIFFDVIEIRIILQITILLALLIMLYYIYKNVNLKIASLILICFIAMDLLTWILTIQGNFVMIIAIITSIFVANKKITDKNFSLILFIVGGITAYLDFLTTPLITFLLPIVIFNLVNNDKTDCKTVLINFIKRAFAWGLGYFLTWAIKWGLCDLLYGTGIIENSIEQFLYRVGITSKYKFKNNIVVASLKFNIIAGAANILNILIILLMYPIILKNIVLNGKNIFFSPNKIVYYISAVLPILWYILIAEHSMHHYFFTYKTMLITLISIVLIICDNKLEKPKED